MTLEVPRVSRQDGPDFLKACLVEGDSLQERRARIRKRRSLALSVLLQFAFAVALVLFPLLGKGERISLKDATPLPPYFRRGNPQPQREIDRRPHPSPACRICAFRTYTHPVISHDSPPSTTANDPISNPELSRFGAPDGRLDGFLEPTVGAGPVPPTNPQQPDSRARRRISEPVQAALLIHRIDPVYPPLARQLRLEGRVELHAIIATDGTIQFLEVISGHPRLRQQPT